MPAAYLLLLREGTAGTEVLLHLRRGTGYRDGHWALLAGHVELGESVLHTAVREAAEEAGVSVTVNELQPLCTVHRTLRGGGPIEQRAVDVDRNEANGGHVEPIRLVHASRRRRTRQGFGLPTTR